MKIKQPTDRLLQLAERIAAKNGGLLPTMTQLVDADYHGLVNAIQNDRGPFEHLLPKKGRGCDKAKYEYVQNHMDDDEHEIAEHLGISASSVRHWKERIRDEEMGIDLTATPRDASMNDVAKFVIKNSPPKWLTNISLGAKDCFVTIRTPDGKTKVDHHAENLSIVQSVVAHVNRARKMAGMDPVQWGE